MIYDLCLVVDSVIVPFSEYYPLNKADDLAFRYHMPTITLLGVSKLVEAEAVEVLYGKNVWRVTSEAPYLTNQPDCPDQWWARRAQLFKHVVMVFDQRDVEHGGYRLKVYHEQLIRVNSQQGSLDERTEAIETMDEIAKSNMEETWAMKLEQVRRMSNLISIKMDVERLYCWTGCCRRRTLQ